MESGAILLYLADKTGRLRGSGKNGWQAVEWLMMQMGSVGPMLGQAHHFLRFNRGKSEYAEKRYGDEAKRIYGVLEQAARRRRVPRRRLFDRRHRDLALDRALRVAGHRLGAVSRSEALVSAR